MQSKSTDTKTCKRCAKTLVGEDAQIDAGITRGVAVWCKAFLPVLLAVLIWVIGSLFPLSIPAHAQESRVPFTYIEQSRSILITAEVNGQRAQLIVDTGSGNSYLDYKVLKLNLKSEGRREVLTATGVTTSNLFTVNVMVGEFKFGGQVQDLDLESLRKSCGCQAQGILGMSALHRFSSVSVDFRAGVLVLKM